MIRYCLFLFNLDWVCVCRKRTGISFCFILLCVLLCACNDSGRYHAAEKEIDYLNQQSYRSWFNNVESSVYYADRALRGAIEIGYKRGIEESYNRLGLAYIPLSMYDSAYACFDYNTSRDNGLQSALGYVGKARIALLTCNHDDYYANIDKADSILKERKSASYNSREYYLIQAELLSVRLYYKFFANDDLGEDLRHQITEVRKNLDAKYGNQLILLDIYEGYSDIKREKYDEAFERVAGYTGISDWDNYPQMHLLNMLGMMIQNDSSMLAKVEALDYPLIPRGESAIKTVSAIYDMVVGKNIESNDNLYRIASTYYKLGHLYNSVNDFTSGTVYLDSALQYINMHHVLNHTSDADTIRLIRDAIRNRGSIGKEGVYKMYDPAPVQVQDIVAMQAEELKDRSFLFLLEMIREQYLVSCKGIRDEEERIKVFNYNYHIFKKLDNYVALSRSTLHMKERIEREEEAARQKRIVIYVASAMLILVVVGMILLSSRKERKRTKDLSLINIIGQRIIQSGKTGIMLSTTPSQCIIEHVYNDIKLLFPKTDLMKIGLYDARNQELQFHYRMQKESEVKAGNESYSLRYEEVKDRPETVCFQFAGISGSEERNGILLKHYYDKRTRERGLKWVEPKNEWERNVQSMICFPLISYMDSHPLGVISIQSYASDAFGRYEMLLFRSVASYITIAIENRQLLDELVEVKKSEQLGYMARGISHEIGSSMGATKLSAMQLKKLAGKLHNESLRSETMPDILKGIDYNSDFIINEIKTIAGIMDSFKLLSRDNIWIEMKEFNVYEKLQNILKSFSPRLQTKNIHVSLRCSHILMVNSFPGEFSLVLGNLLKNSLQHGFAQRDSGNIEIIAQTDPNKTKLTLFYRDDGEGIRPEIREHIFDISYTTNPTGSTGLGLNIVRQVLAKIGGTIELAPSVRKGVEFVIEIRLK